MHTSAKQRLLRLYDGFSDSTTAWARSFADSKTLTEAKREALYEELAADTDMGYAADVLSAKELSAKMLSRQAELT